MKKDPTYPIFKAGLERGKMAVQHAVLSFTEKRFIEDEDRPAKGTPEYDAQLKLVRELAAFLRELDLSVEVQGPVE
jgi:hypothetical protein